MFRKAETDAEAHERLVAKLQHGPPYGIAAVLRAVSTTDEQDGYTWRLLVSDGSKTGELCVTTSTATFDQLNVGKIDRVSFENVIERLAVRYPVATRLRDLLSQTVILEPLDFGV